MNNIFTFVPKRGDIWLRKITTKEDCFIKLETLDMASVDTSSYEVLGVVAHVDKNSILVVYKENKKKAFLNRSWWYLGGYTLDGTERTGIIRAYFSTIRGFISKTITYQAENIDDFVATLNNVFTTDTDFLADDWEASVISGKVRLSANALSNSDSFNVFGYTLAQSGFNLSSSVPELKLPKYQNGGYGKILRKSGVLGDYQATVNIELAKQYLTWNGAGYIPSSPINTLYLSWGINLSVYLGTNPYTNGDMCEYLRSVYGEGEEGWLKLIKSTEPVINTQNGMFAEETGKEITLLLSKMRYNSHKTQNGVFSPMCDYVSSIATATISAGELYAPSLKELYLILRDVKYGTSSDVNSDELNKALYLIGGNFIKNDEIRWWSCNRVSPGYGYHTHDGYGTFYAGEMWSIYGVIPVLHLKVAKPKLNI